MQEKTSIEADCTTLTEPIISAMSEPNYICYESTIDNRTHLLYIEELKIYLILPYNREE